MRVCVIPEYPVSLMTGGLQVQAIELCQALNRLGEGLEAELFSWSEPRPLPEVYHFMGFPAHCASLARLIQQAGVPYLITLLFGNPVSTAIVRQAQLRRWLATRLLRRREPDESILGAARLITVTAADARAARIIYGFTPARLEVVSHGVSEAFYSATPQVWRDQFGDAPFVLCVGAVQPRKHQLRLVECANRLGKPLVLIGPELPGTRAYGRNVADAMAANEKVGGRWIQHLASDSPLLISAYAACRLFALPSQRETQPISVLQAMAARKPVLLGQADYQADPLFAGLPATNPLEAEAFAAALLQGWNEGRPTSLPSQFSWPEVARRLAGVYRAVAEKRPSGFKGQTR